MRFRFAGVYLAQKGDQLVSVPYAKVSVYLAGSTTPATIYTTADGPNYISQTPQITTNKYGEFEFYIDQNDYSGTQKFKIVCEKPGYETKTWDNVCILPTTQEVDNIRNIPVTGLEGTIQTADLLYYEGTKFIVRNIDEILERFYSDRRTFDLLQYDGTNFQVKNIDEIIKDYYNPSVNDVLKYDGTKFVIENIDELLEKYYNPSQKDLIIYFGTQGTSFQVKNIDEIIKEYYNPSVNDLLRYNGTNFEKVSYSISKSDKISDLDGDTLFETERNTDEDIIRGKSGGQDVFCGYSSGIFDLIKQSACIAKRTTDQTIQNSSEVKIQLDNIEYDIQSEFDTTNYRWTATKGGKYIISGCVKWQGNSNGVRETFIRKNGVGVNASRGQFYASGPGNVIIPMSTVCLNVAAGDYIELYVYQDSGTSLNINFAFMSIVKVT